MASTLQSMKNLIWGGNQPDDFAVKKDPSVAVNSSVKKPIDPPSKKIQDASSRKKKSPTSRRRPKDPYMMMPPMPFGMDSDDDDFDDMIHKMRMISRTGAPDEAFEFFKEKHRQPEEHRQPRDKTEIQKAWRLPAVMAPEEHFQPIPMDTCEAKVVNLIESDAQLYRVKEKAEDGTLKIHSILKMMSEVPASMSNQGYAQSDDQTAKSTFNLFMGDVSGSMSRFWPSVVAGWNTHVRHNLIGRTAIMTFGSKVTTKRSGWTNDCYEITQRDFDGNSTDLTGALQKIVEEVYKCKEKIINVFFVTDGGHNETQCQPDDTIEKMRAPEGKICNVYVLGAGNGFPVKYSVNIRSRLHNGMANLPTIFWAKNECSGDMEKQMEDIANYLGQTGSINTIKLSIPGSILPFTSSQDSFHLNEFVYFDKAPEEIQDMSLEIGSCKGNMHLNPKNADVELYLNHVFRQWNGVLIQMHNKKEIIPAEIVPFMGRLFDTVIDELKNQAATTIRSRLASKETKGYEMTFHTLTNTIKNILTKEHYSSDIELANNILSTTVTANKLAEKSLRMKGHTAEAYDGDMEEFRNVVDREKSGLLNVEVTAEDSCRVTLTSTISDLIDEDLNALLELNKYDFLKTFTISGIPIFSPLREAAMLNPWIYGIRRILKSPYTILSQVALESKSTSNADSVDAQYKGVKLQEDDEETYFNAIIPVFPPNIAPKMKQIMRTKIYAMCCTFAILKNPHIIDHNVHMAALAIAWARMLFEHPVQPRPEYVQYRIECVEATAANYTDRPSFAKYLKLLKEDTSQALMTESTVEIDGKSLKCESLVKPMFILHMAVQAKEITENTIIKKIVQTILMEYIGRCLSYNVRQNYDSDEKITYADFFAEILNDQETSSADVKKYIEETRAKLIGNSANLHEEFYYKEQCKKAAKEAANEVIELHESELSTNIPIKVNMGKVVQLRNVSACGDLSWATLKTFSKEVGLPESDVEDLFSEENIFCYVAHGFKFTNSRERLATTIPDYNECLAEVTKMVKDESSGDVVKSLLEKLVDVTVNEWFSTYMEAHAGLPQPMTKSQIIEEAKKKNMDVKEENFDKVYNGYRPSVGLLANACQTQVCPWYLQPSTNYNEHAAAERSHENFPHALHKTIQRYCSADIQTIQNKVVEGKFRKTDKATTHEFLAKLNLTQLKNSYIQMPKQ